MGRLPADRGEDTVKDDEAFCEGSMGAIAPLGVEISREIERKEEQSSVKNESMRIILMRTILNTTASFYTYKNIFMKKHKG